MPCCGSTGPRPGRPSGCRRALRGRRTLPVTVGGLIRYRETPVGPYHEVLASPVVLAGPKGPEASVPFIAVDSLPSVRGGRENWALPKTLARFAWPEQLRGGFELDAEGAGWSVHATVHPRARRLPFAAPSRNRQVTPAGARDHVRQLLARARAARLRGARDPRPDPAGLAALGPPSGARARGRVLGRRRRAARLSAVRVDDHAPLLCPNRGPRSRR